MTIKTKIHAAAGCIAFLIILIFWCSTVLTELFASHESISLTKSWILGGMFILIPAMIIVGASGMSLGKNRKGQIIANKKQRMPVIAATGLVILLPAAFYLENKANNGLFDMWFYIVQVIELIAGLSNLRLIGINIRDGMRLTGRSSVRKT